MRRVNEIVQKNAKREMLVSKARAEESGLVLTDRIFAGRMASFLPGLSVDSVKKGFDRYYHEGNIWRVDYLEAFAHSLFRDVSWMVVSHAPENVKDATSSQSLWKAIGARTSPFETKQIITRVHRLLDNRPLFKLMIQITDVVLDSKNSDQASLALLDLVRNSKAWDAKPVDLRGKKRNPKGRK